MRNQARLRRSDFGGRWCFDGEILLPIGMGFGRSCYLGWRGNGKFLDRGNGRPRRSRGFPEKDSGWRGGRMGFGVLGRS